jgi:hypothetical protein
MTTWTPATSQSETWTEETIGPRVFSPDVFSHASYNGKYVFSMNPRSGVWDRETSTAEVWTEL